MLALHLNVVVALAGTDRSFEQLVVSPKTGQRTWRKENIVRTDGRTTDVKDEGQKDRARGQQGVFACWSPMGGLCVARFSDTVERMF